MIIKTRNKNKNHKAITYKYVAIVVIKYFSFSCTVPMTNKCVSFNLGFYKPIQLSLLLFVPMGSATQRYTIGARTQ